MSSIDGYRVAFTRGQIIVAAEFVVESPDVSDGIQVLVPAVLGRSRGGRKAGIGQGFPRARCVVRGASISQVPARN